ncbi:MAG TPA: hypothetical protein VHU44_01695 [Acidobacteriaceae bacterium]|jgi:hypothetical protein|nr:hypothetical protein [Acidobacteriaceae bacterium]
MNSGHKAALGLLVLLLLAFAPASALASRTATIVRTRNITYHDRTPRVHDTTPKQHHHSHKNL